MNPCEKALEELKKRQKLHPILPSDLSIGHTIEDTDGTRLRIIEVLTPADNAEKAATILYNKLSPPCTNLRIVTNPEGYWMICVEL